MQDDVRMRDTLEVCAANPKQSLGAGSAHSGPLGSKLQANVLASSL